MIRLSYFSVVSGFFPSFFVCTNTTEKKETFIEVEKELYEMRYNEINHFFVYFGILFLFFTKICQFTGGFRYFTFI